MSACGNDPRVEETVEGQYRVAGEDLYLVTAWGEGRAQRWTVTLSADARVYDDPDVFAEMLRQPDSPRLFATADEAIRSLIGGPQ